MCACVCVQMGVERWEHGDKSEARDFRLLRSGGAMSLIGEEAARQGWMGSVVYTVRYANAECV